MARVWDFPFVGKSLKAWTERFGLKANQAREVHFILQPALEKPLVISKITTKRYRRQTTANIRLEKKLSDIKAKTEQEKVEHELSVQSIRRQCEQSKLKLSVAKLVMAGDDNLREYISALERFEFIPVVASPEESDGWDGEVGLVTEAVQRRYEDLRKHEGYLCGSPGMIDAAAKVFIKLGMPEDKIYYDKFS